MERDRLENRRVGELKPIVITTTVRGADKNPSSVRAVGYDCETPSIHEGSATSAGSTSTLSDTALTGANDKWNGMPIWITCAASGKEHKARVTDWVLATTQLIFTTLTEAVASGDKYKIMGEPLMLLAAASVSGNDTTVNLNAAQHGYVGKRRLDVEFTFSGTEVIWHEYEYDVVE